MHTHAHTRTLIHTGTVTLTLSPSHGNILGGETISVVGPCFNNPNALIQCQFDDITRSAIYVGPQEVLCIAPPLQRSGRVKFRLLIDGTVKGQTQFTFGESMNTVEICFVLPEQFSPMAVVHHYCISSKSSRDIRTYVISTYMYMCLFFPIELCIWPNLVYSKLLLVQLSSLPW